LFSPPPSSVRLFISGHFFPSLLEPLTPFPFMFLLRLSLFPPSFSTFIVLLRYQTGCLANFLLGFWMDPFPCLFPLLFGVFFVSVIVFFPWRFFFHFGITLCIELQIFLFWERWFSDLRFFLFFALLFLPFPGFTSLFHWTLYSDYTPSQYLIAHCNRSLFLSPRFPSPQLPPPPTLFTLLDPV